MIINGLVFYPISTRCLSGTIHMFCAKALGWVRHRVSPHTVNVQAVVRADSRPCVWRHVRGPAAGYSGPVCAWQERTSLWNPTPEVVRQRLRRFTVPVEEQDQWESERLWSKVSREIIREDQASAARRWLFHAEGCSLYVVGSGITSAGAGCWETCTPAHTAVSAADESLRRVTGSSHTREVRARGGAAKRSQGEESDWLGVDHQILRTGNGSASPGQCSGPHFASESFLRTVKYERVGVARV